MLLLLLPLGSCNDVAADAGAAAKGARRSRPAEGGERIEEPAENSLLLQRQEPPRETRRVQRSFFPRRRTRGFFLFFPFAPSSRKRLYARSSRVLQMLDPFVGTFVRTLPLFDTRRQTGGFTLEIEVCRL